MNTLILTLILSSTPAEKQLPLTEITDSVNYNQAQMRTYEDAREECLKTRKPLIVWVNLRDFDLYKKVSQFDGIHVFVNNWPDLYQGVVIGEYQQGKVNEVKQIKTKYAEGITSYFRPLPATPKYTQYIQPQYYYRPPPPVCKT